MERESWRERVWREREKNIESKMVCNMLEIKILLSGLIRQRLIATGTAAL